MGCTRPLIRWSESGKIIGLSNYLNWKTPYTKRNPQDKPKVTTELLESLRKEKAQLIPCGQCMGCRIEQSRQWANRMELELAYHKDSWFVTLTYDDEHLRQGYNVNPETGELIIINNTLFKKDLQDFWKRLRQNIDRKGRGDSKKLMYYACGEYGSQTHRPHYHAIVYDLPIKPDELKELKRERGFTYYDCPWLQKVWGKGYIIVCGVSWETCAYVARYVTKKRKGKGAKEWYESMAIQPEFVCMSLKPAIGQRYYEEHKEEIYPKDSIQLANGKRCKPPRYFDKKYDEDHGANEKCNEFAESIEEVILKMESAEMREIKRKRRIAANDALFAKLKKSGQNLEQLLKNQELSIEERSKGLIRPDN